MSAPQTPDRQAGGNASQSSIISFPSGLPAALNREYQQSWVTSGPRWRMHCSAFCLGFVVFLVTALLHWAIGHESGVLGRQVYADLLAAILISLFAYRSYVRRRDRLDMLMERIREVAELNHHVRNALQLITLRIYSTGDRELIDDISRGTDRISWALKEVLSEKPNLSA